MNLAQIWGIVWDNEPFHWTTAIVLFVAVIFEVYTLRQYWYSECGEIATAIQSLKNLNKNQKQDNSKVRQWKDEHLKIKNGKFILIKYPSILARPIPRSSLRFVTTLCTAIGVLGTFYGIQQGLQEINLDTTNSQQLMSSSKELLVGMKTAFSTSLMGLGSGSLFTIILFICDSLRQKRRDDLRKKLKAIATLETADNADYEIAQVLNLVADKLTGINLSAEIIGEAVGKQMQSIILSALQAILQEQQKLRELQQNQGQKVLEELIKDLRVQVLEPIADRLDKSAELTQQASQAVMTLHKDLGTSIDTIQKFQKETLGELQKFAQNLGQTLSQFQTDTKGVLEQTALEINRAVNQSIEGMTAQRSAFEASADSAATSFRGIRQELEAALRERAEIEQQMLQGVRDDIEQTINRTTITFQQQTNTLKTVGNQASGLMNEAKESLIATLGNIDDTLTTTRKTVQSDLTKFREEYQGNLQAFFTIQNNLLEGTLGKQRDGLAAVVTNLDTVFQHEATRRSELAEEVNNSMTTIHKAAEEVGKLAIATGLNSNQRLMQLQELARDINEQVQGVKREYRELSTTSKELSATFNHNLTAWKNHFENWQTKFFGEADNAMAKVWTNVLTTADVLVAAKNSGDNGGNHNG